MKPKTLILMVVAVTCGLVASYMTSRLLADRGQQAVKVPVLVAKKTISQGDLLKIPEDMFEEKWFTQGDEPKLAITKAELLKGRVLNRSLRAGDFITPEDLVDSSGNGVMYNLPVGHNAIGIRVNSESIAGGFASLPNSRVNIISTVRRGNDRDSYSKILIENVLVLAADTQTRVQENGQAMPANVVTVALKPEDVLKVELAKTLGTISLALRKFNDQSKSENDTFRAEGLTGGTGDSPETATSETSPPAAVPVVQKEQPKPAAGPVAKDSPKKSTHVLEIFNGDKHEVVQYHRDAEPRSTGPVIGNGDTPVPQTPAPKKNETPAGGN